MGMGISKGIFGLLILDSYSRETCTEKDCYEINKLKLYACTKEIKAEESKETVILEGEYQGRKVAVKRRLRALHNVASQEAQNLIKSDQHPNIVRYFCKEKDKNYVYLVLERCICNLNDLILLHANPRNSEATGAPWKTDIQGINLWKGNGYPTALLLKLMRDMVDGLVHLHGLGIIHQDIKPQNVMIAKRKGLCAKLSDIGINKWLPSDMPSLSRNDNGCGSSSSEQILWKDQMQAVDMFSLGCVFLFCLTRGAHSFDHDKLQCNIRLYSKNHRPEAIHLLSRLMNPDSKERPTAFQVLYHPIFWESEMRLSFLRHVSDWLESEYKRFGSNILNAVESVARPIFGRRWDKNMDQKLVKDIGCYRHYRYWSVQDLLRVVRNKFNHYYELPLEIQQLLGPIPEGFDNYFSVRYPRLLMEVYKVFFKYCRTEKCFEKYFRLN